MSCPKTADIQVSVETQQPTGTPKGTILLHSGVGGTGFYNQVIGGTSYVQSFLAAGYRVVQLAWATDWEDTTITPKSIKLAACRPATLLNYVYNTIHGGPAAAGGMCALGHSGGSAAVAYALTWYNAASYLDTVVLTSGPVFSDIEKGCQVPLPPNQTVCVTGEYGCDGAPWLAPVTLPVNVMQTWTGDSTCQNSPGGTSAASNAAWKAMSIVDGTSNANFSYPKTALSAYLCNNGTGSANGQGGIYYSNFTGSGQAATYAVHSISGCQKEEDIWDGTTVSGVSGFNAVISDFTDPVRGCIKRH